MKNTYANLDEAIKDHEWLGSFQARLGRAKIPEGYAIMVNPDGTHCYWINAKGDESGIHWDKWTVLRGAKAHSAGAYSAPTLSRAIKAD